MGSIRNGEIAGFNPEPAIARSLTFPFTDDADAMVAIMPNESARAVTDYIGTLSESLADMATVTLSICEPYGLVALIKSKDKLTDYAEFKATIRERVQCRFRASAYAEIRVLTTGPIKQTVGITATIYVGEGEVSSQCFDDDGNFDDVAFRDSIAKIDPNIVISQLDTDNNIFGFVFDRTWMLNAVEYTLHKICDILDVDSASIKTLTRTV